MRRPHYLALASAAALFALLFWGLEYRPRDVVRAEQTRRGLSLASTSAQSLIREALPALDARTEAEVHGLSKMLDAAAADARRVELLRDLSGAWYRAGHPAIAGHYAERVAEVAPSDTAWGLAGTTYSLCLRADSLADKPREFCRERAVLAYENAISLAPEESSHKLNLALLYADHPPADNPMRGIRMLLDLNAADPDDVAVLVQLGRLALRTGQDDRALERLMRAVELAPGNRSAQCLLGEAAAREGIAELAAASAARCRALSEADPE